jgi:hypothetical protein
MQYAVCRCHVESTVAEILLNWTIYLLNSKSDLKSNFASREQNTTSPLVFSHPKTQNPDLFVLSSFPPFLPLLTTSPHSFSFIQKLLNNCIFHSASSQTVFSTTMSALDQFYESIVLGSKKHPKPAEITYSYGTAGFRTKYALPLKVR